MQLEAIARVIGPHLNGVIEREHLFERFSDDSVARLSRSRKRTLRRLHAEGRRELEVWRKILFNGRPHPYALRIDQALDAQIERLRNLSPRERRIVTLP
ncbi:hypothetical protein [Sphingosinicella sp.]|uniref:hypothetical protein n=1 Tax=Sphingosinicella sp. TaxID=1917971 RepID=UPI00403786AE